MKITIQGEDFNRIMRTCIPSLDRADGVREGLKYIEIRGKDGHATATSSNGFHLSHCAFTYEGDTECHFLLPRHKTVKNDCFVTVAIDNEEISVSDGEETLTRKAVDIAGAPDWPRIVENGTKEAGVRRVGVSRKFLRRLLDSYSGDDVLLLEIPKNPIKPIVIRNTYAWGMVLPFRFNGEPHKQEFSDPLATTKSAE